MIFIVDIRGNKGVLGMPVGPLEPEVPPSHY